MSLSQNPELLDSTKLLLGLARKARRSESIASLQFMLVNQTLILTPYLVALFWVKDEGVVIQSGVSDVESNAPFVLWVNELCDSLAGSQAPMVINSELISEKLSSTWDEVLPPYLLWLPLLKHMRNAGLLIAREEPFSEEEINLLNEWFEIWAQSWARFDAPSAQGEIRRFWRALFSRLPDKKMVHDEALNILAGLNYILSALQENPKLFVQWITNCLKKGIDVSEGTYRWLKIHRYEGSKQALISEAISIWNNKRRRWRWIFWIAILFPVRLTVLAPGELVPEKPAIIRVPVDGVVDEFYVAPNERVVSGQPLFRLDLTTFLSRLQVAQQETLVATQEYRQSALQSLTDAKSRGQLASQEGKAAERKIEADYLQSILEKAKIEAPRDGVVIFDDPSEWIGKPVAAGEKVMIVATENDVEIEAWIPVGDILETPRDAPVTLYLNAMPFSPVSGRLRYIGHEPIQRPDGSYAYRVRAVLPKPGKGPRIGLKGTAKVSGEFVPLVYWVLRKPLASMRQFIGI